MIIGTHLHTMPHIHILYIPLRRSFKVSRSRCVPFCGAFDIQLSTLDKKLSATWLSHVIAVWRTYVIFNDVYTYRYYWFQTCWIACSFWKSLKSKNSVARQFKLVSFKRISLQNPLLVKQDWLLLATIACNWLHVPLKL